MPHNKEWNRPNRIGGSRLLRMGRQLILPGAKSITDGGWAVYPYRYMALYFMKRILYITTIIFLGLGTIYISRFFLLIFTYPHSVIIAGLLNLWHWIIALIFCIIILSVFIYFKRQYSRCLLYSSIIFAIISFVLLRLVYNISFMNNLIEGFWVK